MINLVDKQETIPFFKRTWVSCIGVFVLSQLIFITFEVTGWSPNYREMDGTLFGKITESSLFGKWFSFYEIPHLNMLTVFFGVTLLVPGIIGAIKDVLFSKPR